MWPPLHARLSEHTRYLRYFPACPRIPASELNRLVSVDHHDGDVVVAELNDQLIAVGRYQRLAAGGPDAEVAVVVEDAYQRRGLGLLLLSHLAVAAGRRRVARFVAEVLPDNPGIVAGLVNAGYHVERQHRTGVVHVRFAIRVAAVSGVIRRGG